MPSLPMNSGRSSKKTKTLFSGGGRGGRLLDSGKFGTVIRYLILSGRIGKHTDQLTVELVINTQGKTDCTEWHTDGWGGYERVLRDDRIEHYISKALTQRVERTNGILRQQTGRWHRRQNKFSKLWQQSEVTLKLVISYFNWIWQHSCLGTTAAQRAELTECSWTWNDIVTYPTLV